MYDVFSQGEKNENAKAQNSEMGGKKERQHKQTRKATTTTTTTTTTNILKSEKEGKDSNDKNHFLFSFNSVQSDFTIRICDKV